jgi:type IV secretory pathway component VirB8
MNPWASKINPWYAQPLTDASKDAKLRAVLSIAAERVIYGRQAIIVSWVVFGLGLALLCVSIVGWVLILPLKTIQNEIWVADQTTGIIAHPVRLEDAAVTFSKTNEEHYLRQYVEAREQWMPERDIEDDHIVKVMSSPEEQTRLNFDRLKPDSNAKSIGPTGHVVCENYRFYQQATDKDSQTKRYLVRFNRTVWRNGNKEASEPWSASVDFQWHPERAMSPADREINPGGFVEIAYSSKSELPATRRE